MYVHHFVIVVLYVAAAILPGIALWRVFRASRDEAAIYEQAPDIGDQMSVGQHDVMMRILHQRMRRGPVFVLTDAVLVGGGLVLGAVASIWAVVDSA